MRILQLITSMDPAAGGTVEVIRQMAPVLIAMGHTTEVACLDAPGSPWINTYPFPIHAVDRGWTGYRFSRRWIPWLREQATNFDVVIIHGVWQFTSYGGWLALRSLGIPYYLYTHGMLDPWFERTYPLKHIKKVIYWWLTEQYVFRDAQAVLFTCEQEKLLARNAFLPYICREVVVNLGTTAPSGDPDQQRQVFAQHFPQLQGRRFILFMGRIYIKKGCDLLIQAFAQVAQRDPDLHLVMAGPDQVGWVKTLQAMADSLHVGSRVTFTGLLQDDVKWGAFHSADVFALPSHQENFGFVVVEALACGVPVLISNQVNIWEEIVQDQAGWAAPDTVEGTVSLLQHWLELSPEARQKAREAALKSFRTRFEMTQAAQSLITVLKQPAS
ncbi:MAG: glycosyltransferase [Synechococcales cyanobacterium]